MRACGQENAAPRAFTDASVAILAGSYKRVAFLLAVLLLSIGASVRAQVATYERSTGLLTLPIVQVGVTWFRNVILRDLGGYFFSLESAQPHVSDNVSPSAAFDPVAGVLSIPSVRVEGETHSGVTLSRSGSTGYTFALRSVTPRGAEQAFYSDTFDADYSTSAIGLSGLWSAYGQDVRLDFRQGWVSIQENATDVYSRIESGVFSPASLVRLKLRHHMVPSTSAPDYFFPMVDFQQTEGQSISFRWLRSRWAPDYCNTVGGFDRVLVRYSSITTPCAISTLASSSLYNRVTPVDSVIEIDLHSGTLKYLLDGASTPAFVSALPLENIRPIKKIVISGYGWNIGHRHEVDRLELTVRPAESLPSPPLRATVSSEGRPWLPTLAEHYNFAGKENYWGILLNEPYRSNHIGSDLAVSRDGRLRVGAHMVGAEVLAICDGTVKENTTGYANPASAFLKVEHSMCGGQTLTAYYGHIASERQVGEVVTRGDVIGTVADQGSLSHLHLTLDTNSGRSLSSRSFVDCGYTLAGSEVTALWGCSIVRSIVGDEDYLDSDVARLQPGRMLLRLGFGQLNVRAFRDATSVAHHVRADPDAALYIQEAAMRCQGFIPLTDLWDRPSAKLSCEGAH